MKLRIENVNETKGRRRNKNKIVIRSKKWKRWITQVFELRTFLRRESFEQKLLERWREIIQKDLLKEMKEDIER